LLVTCPQKEAKPTVAGQVDERVSEVIGPVTANRPEVTPRGVYQIKHLEGVT